MFNYYFLFLFIVLYWIILFDMTIKTNFFSKILSNYTVMRFYHYGNERESS